MDLVTMARGVDYHDAVVALAVGERPALRTGAERASCVWFPTARPGRVVGLRGFDDLLGMDGVVSARLTVGVGDMIRRLRSSDDRIGSVLITADNGAQLRERLHRVQELLTITVEEQGEGDDVDGQTVGEEVR
jgi:hypothetical protein